MKEMTTVYSLNRKSSNPVPRRLILIVLCALCFGLLASALFTFTTLSRLRIAYLSNRGHEIVASFDAQVRGPDRRHSPAVWQSVFEAGQDTYSDSIAYLALLDREGKVLAGIGQLPESFAGISGNIEQSIYHFEEALPRPRNRGGEAAHAITAGWRLRVGLNTKDSDFIKRMAFLQMAISGLAIAALIVLSIYLIRIVNRFLELKGREAAEAQLKSLGIMSASLAHEIRNPLGAMKGLTQLAQEELPPDHVAQTQLRTVVNEAKRLEKLVTDLLDFARKREPQISEFDLAELLADIERMLQSRLETSKTSLRISLDSDPFQLQSDSAGLRQVLLNVILNAIDATPANQAVVVTARRSDDTALSIIRVDDSGSGIGQQTSEELTQPFVTTKVRGTGLGLAISRQIIESLGGSLSLENLPQGGARCSITIPMR